VILHYSTELFLKNRTLAVARMSLKRQGIMGLNHAPCIQGLLQQLPNMLQDQYTYEKVSQDLYLLVVILHLCY